MATTASTTSYWCYRCTRFVAALISQENNDVTCPHCDGGFIEQIEANSQSDNHNPQNRFMYTLSGNNGRNTQDSDRFPTLRFRRNRRNAGDRSPFNPVFVLRGTAAEDNSEEESSYVFYYDDGTGLGLRPIPASMSEFLMGSGFDRLLEQLAQIEVNGLGRVGNPPASKAAVEALPTVEINGTHLYAEEHCAVCKEAFEIGGEAREMPCKHIYHSECILPWLAMRNSCPVCRHEVAGDQQESENSEEAEEIVGLTIWRLPGGGFAVGRFSGGRRGGEREFPGVFTEMDGGFSGSGEPPATVAPRRVSWVSRTSRRRDRNGNSGLRRVFSGLISSIRRRIGSSSNSNSNSNNSSSSIDSEMRSMSRSSSQSSSGFGRYVTGRRRGLDVEVENGTDRW